MVEQLPEWCTEEDEKDLPVSRRGLISESESEIRYPIVKGGRMGLKR